MVFNRRKTLFYISAYVIIAVIAILSMGINVKTYTYIDKRHTLLLELQDIKEVNRDLAYEVGQKTSLEHIELKARELGMVPPKSVTFLDHE